MKLKLLIAFVGFAVINLLPSACCGQLIDITVEVKGLKSPSGSIFYAVYDSDDHFLIEEHAIATGEIKIENTETHKFLVALGEGKYAIAVTHDVNANGYMDTNRIGIPKEPYGFSNNAKGFMGPPDFESCAIDFDSDMTVGINLR